MDDIAFDANCLGFHLVFSISMPCRGYINFEWWDKHFIKVFIVVLFGIHVKGLCFVGGDNYFFEFVVNVFLDIVVVADAGVDVEEISYCADFCSSKRV